MRALGLVLYGLAVLPILFALFAAWYALSWGIQMAGWSCSMASRASPHGHCGSPDEC